MEARAVMSSGMTASHFKYVTGTNQHRKRNRVINSGCAIGIYPSCLQDKDWAHVIKCPTRKRTQKEYIRKAYNKIVKS